MMMSWAQHWCGSQEARPAPPEQIILNSQPQFPFYKTTQLDYFSNSFSCKIPRFSSMSVAVTNKMSTFKVGKDDRKWLFESILPLPPGSMSHQNPQQDPTSSLKTKGTASLGCSHRHWLSTQEEFPLSMNTELDLLWEREYFDRKGVLMRLCIGKHVSPVPWSLNRAHRAWTLSSCKRGLRPHLPVSYVCCTNKSVTCSESPIVWPPFSPACQVYHQCLSFLRSSSRGSWPDTMSWGLQRVA